MLSSPIVVLIPPSMQMTDEQFFEFCQVNRDLRIERNKLGEISIMPPTDSETGNRNFNIALQVGIWAEQDGTGICFDSTTGFKLSTGADRSPHVSWIKLERWNTLSSEQQQRFAPICPDFVVELRSASDNLQPLKEKMEEYMREPGIQLGWLIDRKHRKVYIYRPGMPKECLENPDNISGDRPYVAEGLPRGNPSPVPEEQGSLPERKAGQQGALRDRILPGFVLNTSKVW